MHQEHADRYEEANKVDDPTVSAAGYLIENQQ